MTTIIKVQDQHGQGLSYISVDEVLFPATSAGIIHKKLRNIKSFQYRDGDVILCGYPKSGNHWMANIIHLLSYKGSIAQAPSVRLPLLEYDEREVVNKSPRLISSHLRFKFLPTQHVEKGGKIVLVVRNPKDVLVSYYYHLKNERNFKNKQLWDSFVDSFLQGNVLYSSYFDYLNTWQEVTQSKHPPSNILVVMYEDLLTNTFTEVKRIQEFLGYNNSDSRLAEIISRTTLRKLKADVDTGKVKTILVDKKGHSILYRKGVIGDWKSHLTVEQNAAFDRVMAVKLRHSIFQFRFEPRLSGYGCPPGWLSNKGFCYLLVHDIRHTWFFATQDCINRDGWLADIRDADEEVYLRQTIGQLHNANDPEKIGYWISANDLAVEGTWVWGFPTQGRILS